MAKSTLWACCRAIRVSSDVGSADVTTASVSIDAAPPDLTAAAAASAIALEALGDGHLAGRHEQLDEAEGVGAGVLGPRAHRHRGAQLVDRGALGDVVVVGRLGARR